MDHHQRRVRDEQDAQHAKDQEPDDTEMADLQDAGAIVTENGAWVLVGQTWVDVDRIMTVGPLSNIWDEDQGKEGIEMPEGGVAVQIDSGHPDTQFIQDENENVLDIMSRIIDAQSD